MNEQHQREEEIFDAACPLPPEARANYLNQACGGNRELRQAVEALLKSHDQTHGVLERPSAGKTLLLSVPPSEKPGDPIGHYKLLQQIGEGGCGVVYMAEQEEPVRRRVALKIIKLGMDTKQVIARFEAERQALAMMEHPNIAKVLDAGATETGRPYFVMELVRGVRITDYCDAHKLSTEERLKLFVQVCQAVQHAHQKGVIHRDLKPSNILVTINDGVPVPKVIDFGIAKSTQGRLTDQTLFTAFEQFMGTPAYMSPEQAVMTSLDVDTRTDIYSLGVLLYELLTGRTPFDQKELLAAGLDEMRRTIRDKEPARPSTRLSTLAQEILTTTAQQRHTEVPKLIHRLRGDLDWIVMKALDKDRTRRYETANGLAVDIQRHLDNEPVVARPPSRLYRFQKAYQRNRFAFSAGLAVVLALAMGLGLAAVGWRETRVERDKARKAQQETEAARKGEEAQRREAQAAQKLSETESLKFQFSSYVADMNLAARALEDSDFGRARELLAKHKPQPDKPDFRNWEWRYLSERTRSDELKCLGQHSNAVFTVTFSPDGRLLASGGLDGVVRLWKTDSWESAGAWQLPWGVLTMAFSPDGKLLITGGEAPSATGGTKKQIIAWDFPNHQGLFTNDWNGVVLAFGCNGEELYVGSNDGHVAILDPNTGERTGEIRVGQDGISYVNSLTFSPDGQRLWIGAEDRTMTHGDTLSAWDIKTRRQLWSKLPHPWYVRDLKCSPDGRTIASCGGERTVRLWDAQDGSPVGELKGHVWYVYALSFSPDGRWLASAGVDQTIIIWDVTNRSPAAKFHGNVEQVWSLAYAPDGTSLASAAEDGTVRVWPGAPPRTNVNFLPLPPGGFEGRLSKSGSYFFMLNADGLSVLETASGKLLDRRRDGVGAVFSPDETLVCIAGRDLKQAVYSLPDFSFLKSLPAIPLNTTVRSAFSSDGRILASGLGSGHITLMDWRSGNTLGTCQLPDGVRSIVFGPRDENFATGGIDGSLRLWRTTDASLLAVFPGYRHHQVLSLAFSPDGTSIVSCGGDAVSLWDVKTQRQQQLFKGHRMGVGNLIFSKDGRRFFTGGNDGEIRVWDVPSAQLLLTIPAHRLEMRLALQPDDTLVSASIDGIRFWRAPSLSAFEVPVPQ